MEDTKLWVFRLAVEGYEGEPTDVCDVHIDRQDILRYWDTVSSLDDAPYYDKDDLNLELFKGGKLRQGWGLVCDGMNLDLNQPRERWIENFMKLGWRVWREKNDCKIAMGRWKILRIMKYMKEQDIIFIPRTPEENRFTVARVNKEYDFQKFNGFLGHGHVIGVEKIEDFSYGNHNLPKIIFRHYRKAINEIREHHKNFEIFNDFLEKNYL